jgi:hypothetical protein
MLLFFCFSMKAEEWTCERVFVHTDKDCYLAGENILLKFFVVNGNFIPSPLSKVGYIEICNTEKPQVQLKIALENGSGAGKMTIPADLPTGTYQLSGYTRFMRNEDENVFFKKQIAIINTRQQADNRKRFELVESYEKQQFGDRKQYDPEAFAGLLINVDKNEYATREKVELTIGNIPVNTTDLVISVTGIDSTVLVQDVDKQEWLKQVTTPAVRFSQQWTPEYEGHIITGNIVPKPTWQQLTGGIAFVGKDIRYMNGRINPQNWAVDFYTTGAFGKQQIVTSVTSQLYDSLPYRMDLLNPFCELLPDTIPVLRIFPNERQLLERYLGVQMQEKTGEDTLDIPVQSFKYKSFEPVTGYDLDEYVRFSTIAETILEYVTRLRVGRVNDRRIITVYLEEDLQFTQTLVLLDGVPVPERDHEELLFRYNPALIKYLNIYEGRYVIGGNIYNCIVSLTTYKGDYPIFKLSNQMQLFNYDCPQLPSLFKSPDYSDDEAKKSRKPDFRHTLYWNPFVESGDGQPVTCSFFTSDLCGAFKVTVEGITTDGKMINGVSYFRVTTP